MIVKIKAEIKKSIRYWKKHKAVALVSIFPPLLICLLFVGVFQTTGIVDIAVVNGDAASTSAWTEKFMEVLETRTGTIPYFDLVLTDDETAENMFQMHETFAVLHIPEGFGESVEVGEPEQLTIEFTAAHEDISKNVRLGIEARIYDFIKQYGLDTGDRPGIVIAETLQHEALARSSYMMAGILIWTISFFGLLIGGALGANEREGSTETYIRMAPNGDSASLIGKWLAAMLLSSIMMIVLTLCYMLFFGLQFPDVASVLYLLAVFLVLSAIFSLPGVLYGRKAGDFRLVPAPMIILSITLWLISGALNPLEFSAGSPVFKLLPTASGIRIMSYALFNRGEQFVREAWLILLGWFVIVLLAFGVFYLVKRQKNPARALPLPGSGN